VRIVIASVHYGDFLALTLPRWRQWAPKATLIVATAPGDAESLSIAEQVGAIAIVTDVWTAQAPVENERPKTVRFNKARALDLAFGFAPGHVDPPDVGERCLSLDADVVPFGPLPRQHDLDPETLYGCPRYYCQDTRALHQHELGRLPLERFNVMGPRKGHRHAPHGTATATSAAIKCLGYFQLFRYRPGVAFGSFSSAGKYDLVFHRHFKARAVVPKAYVLHLGESDRSNWTGRTVPRWVA